MLSPSDKKKLSDYCRTNAIAYLGVFGSVARGEARADSDIDLLVRFQTNIGLLDLVRVRRELAELLSRPVDLVTENALSRHLKQHIIESAKVIYESAG